MCARPTRRNVSFSYGNVKEPDNGRYAPPVTDTATGSHDGAIERLELEGGSIQILRGGEGPPLLFLHAAGGAGTWLPFHALLARHFEVIAPDHPGFGGSDELAAVEGIDDLVYHYLEVMDRLGLERPIVVGASLGGWIAAELAVHTPDRVGKLALLGAAGLRIADHMPTDLFLLTPQQLVTTLYKHPDRAAGLFPDDPDVEFILAVYRDNTAFARYGWAPFLNDPKLERRLHRITAPTLVLWADDDRVMPIEHGRRYAERIPDATLHIVEDCGHAMYFERTEAVADAVIAFLTGSEDAS
jgi:pimeloyl-ACP methyl ester carboxylesterase